MNLQKGEDKEVYRVIETVEPRARRKVPLRSGRGLYDWMKRVNGGEDLTGVENPGQRITLDEVRKHCTWDDAWIGISDLPTNRFAVEILESEKEVSKNDTIKEQQTKISFNSSRISVLRGIVYNVTPYLEYHPGGVEELLRGVGRDCTPLFDEVHSWVNIPAFLGRSRVGVLVGGGGTNLPMSPPPPLFQKMTLNRIEKVNHDSFILNFKTSKTITLQPGQHLKLKATIVGRLHTRPYTPINIINESFDVELLVKAYPDGAFSQYLTTLSEGAEVQYQIAPNRFLLKRPPTAIGMIAGGTGLTPFVRILRELIGEKRAPEMDIRLLFANTTEQDILCRDELNKYTVGSNFQVNYVVSRPSDSWEGLKGRINADLIKTYMPSPAEGVKILVCGPIEMVNSTISMLIALGYNGEMIHEFV